MGFKTFVLPQVGEVRLEKRRSQKHIRISVKSDGQIRVSMPYWLPYSSAISFASSKTDWISSQLIRRPPPSIIKCGDRIGKHHIVTWRKSASQKPIVRVVDHEIRLYSRTNDYEAFMEAQKNLIKACEKALHIEASAEIPHRLRDLAQIYGFTFKSVKIKKLKSKWGSCSNDKEIVLNIYMAQLPETLIDYILVHELVHTKHLDHQAKFWEKLGSILPNHKLLRKHLKTFPTAIFSTNEPLKL